MAGEQFPVEEITEEKMDRTNRKKYYLIEQDNTYYRTLKTDQLTKAIERETRTQQEIQAMNIEQWLDENRPGLDEKTKGTLLGNASFVYHLFRNHRDFFENEVVTVEEIKTITFEFLKTDDLQKAFGELSRIERQLEEKLGQAISPEEIEESSRRLLQKDHIIADPQLIEDLPKLAPYQLDERYLTEEAETQTQIIKKYQRQFGNNTVTYTFIIPKEEYQKGATPTFGQDFRKAVLCMYAFAVEQETFSPKFRKEHIFKLQGKQDNEIKGGMYERLDNIFKTIAYATYEIQNDKKGKDYRRTIGHMTNNVNWEGKGRGSFINPTLNTDYFSDLPRRIKRETPSGQFLLIPKDRVTEKRSRDEENFLNYIDTLKGLKKVHAIKVKTIFVNKLGYQTPNLRKMGSGAIRGILDKCLTTAKETGRLKEWNWDYGIPPDYKKILTWKVTLVLSQNKILTQPRE